MSSEFKEPSNSDANTITTSTESKSKFDRNGNARSYPGMTIVWHLPEKHNVEEELDRQILRLYYGHGNQDFIPETVILPADSWHMTMVDLYTCARDDSGCTEIPAGRLDEYRESFGNASAELEKLLPVTMCLEPDRAQSRGTSLKIPVKPLRKQDEETMEAIRQLVSSRLKVTLDPKYQYHITLRYFIKNITKERFAEIDRRWAQETNRLAKDHEDLQFTIGKAELCTFEDMTRFTPIAVVKSPEERWQ